MSAVCIGNATVVTMDPSHPLVPNGVVVVADGRVRAVGPAGLRADHADAAFVDAGGGLVMPGLVCAHTHLYSAFARGMSLPGEPARTFVEILERLWWRLDRLLTLEDVAASAEVGLLDAIRHGVTTVIDHHASPAAVDGSLDVIAAAVEAAGVRACLAYEVSERNGPADTRAAVRENERFIQGLHHRAGAGAGRLAGLVGLHASFTLSPATLATCVGVGSDLGVGCHVHVAEDRADQEDCRRRQQSRVVPHLAARGVLGPGSLAAHCVHVDGGEIAALARTGAAVAHNPRSNMGNAVGTAPVPALRQAGVTVGLGSDGVSMDLFEEMRAAQLQQRLATGDPRAMPPAAVVELAFAGGGRIADTLFAPFAPGLGPLGRLQPGGPADLVVLDYAAPTPLTVENAAAHLLWGLGGAQVRDTMVAGRWLMRAGQVLTLDAERITARSRERAAALWARVGPA